MAKAPAGVTARMPSESLPAKCRTLLMIIEGVPAASALIRHLPKGARRGRLAP